MFQGQLVDHTFFLFRKEKFFTIIIFVLEWEESMDSCLNDDSIFHCKLIGNFWFKAMQVTSFHICRFKDYFHFKLYKGY